MRLSPAGRHIKAIVMSAAGSKPVRIHNQFSAQRESGDNKASPPASAAACRKISSFISKETRGAKNLEGRQSPTNRDSSVFRHSLDVHLQTGGLDRYGTHDSRHVPPGSKAGIRHRAALREAFGQTFNSLRLFWHSAQTAVLHRRAGEDDFHLDCARPPAFEPDGRRRTPFGV